MGDPKLEVWTRKTFAVKAGALAAALFGVGRLAGADANRKRDRRKQKRRKRCQPIGSTCRPDAKRTCCGTLVCEPFFGRFFCCKSQGRPCAEDRNECCQPDLVCTGGFCESSP